MARPKVDLHLKIVDILADSKPVATSNTPIKVLHERLNSCFLMLNYIDQHIRPVKSNYKGVFDSHATLLRRMALGHLIEAFELFIKELAIHCIDLISPYVFDDRFKSFKLTGDTLTLNFESKTVGKALCQSDTWINNKGINERFRSILGTHFGLPWKESLFPDESQTPVAEQPRAKTLSILWQIRHNITHNTGVLTEADARRFTLMTKSTVEPRRILSPTLQQLKHVQRFLHEAAESTNSRVAQRLADLLSQLYLDDNSLFVPQDQANYVSSIFGIPLTVSNAIGTV